MAGASYHYSHCRFSLLYWTYPYAANAGVLWKIQLRFYEAGNPRRYFMENTSLYHRFSTDLFLYALDSRPKLVYLLYWNTHHGHLFIPRSCIHLFRTMYQFINQTKSSFGNSLAVRFLCSNYFGFLLETIYHIYQYLQ